MVKNYTSTSASALTRCVVRKSQGSTAEVYPKSNPVKFFFKWSFLIVRAALRFVFIDFGGRDYFKSRWTPSINGGSDMPGLFLPPLIVLCIVLSPIWAPIILWEMSTDLRGAFVRWIGEDQ